MSFLIGNYSFKGPFCHTDQIENKSGIFVAICSGNENFVVVDIGGANNIKTAIKDNLKKHRWDNFCSTELLFACYYIKDRDQNKREIVKNEIKEEYLPLVIEK